MTFKQAPKKEKKSQSFLREVTECCWKGDSMCKGPEAVMFVFAELKEGCYPHSVSGKGENGIGTGWYLKEPGEAGHFSNIQEFYFFPS